MAESRVEEVLDAVVKNGAKDMEKIQPTISLKLQSSLDNCFNRSGDNPDRFATCMGDTQKKAQELMDTFQFKQLFLSRTIETCLAKRNDV